MTNIAIIPARSGSKRIPRKNLREFVGVPVIQRTINKAIESKLFTRIIISTDSGEIAKLAKDAGAEVPFIRKKELADDYTSTLEVIHDSLRQANIKDGIISCIYPVTPLLDYNYVSKSIEMVQKTKYSYVFAAGKLPTNPARTFHLKSMNFLEIQNKNGIALRSQDLEDVYYDLGQFYTARFESWYNRLPIISNSSGVICLEPWEAVDVDTESDWKFCEKLFELTINL